MLRHTPDWLVYLLALAALVIGVFSISPEQNAPPATPDSVEREGATLPPPSAFDEAVLVRVEAPRPQVVGARLFRQRFRRAALPRPRRAAVACRSHCRR